MIAVIDYGMGNLRSVQKGFQFVGYDAEITSESSRILDSTHVVLPGVGAFADAMDNLRNSGLIDTLHKVIDQEKPFMGICLGMQLLFEKSYEGGVFQGLNLIPEIIDRIPDTPGLKVPHMGWNSLSYKDNIIFQGLGSEPHVYFVHSYYLKTPCEQCVIGTTEYGMDIQVAVNHDNIFGLQFHPEKSGDIGLQILKNFGGIDQ